MTADPSSWARVSDALARLGELPRAERDRALLDLQVSDPAVHAEVVSLLEALDTLGDRFERAPLLDVDAPDTFGILPGSHIGPYRLIREVGRGGMGTVYEALRDDEQYQKRVAIKMVAAGRDTERMLERFRRERGLLARLEHRNIAALLDGGVTPEGQPWFAMEYVEGESITAWCDSHRLGVRQRIELFRQVCAAVQYAHEHLVIHRDLKPGNVFVADDGTVKLLDFGVAKLEDPSDQGGTRTATGMVPLTAGYASPEQLRGDPVSTGSDIYSLGVVLYELVTGARPFSMGQGLDQRTATAPSRAVTDAAAAMMGESAPRRVAHALRGDLDAVVLMALRPEPARRYRSVQQLNDDLQRALTGRPVVARPDTLAYRTGSLIRRNTVASAASLLALVAMTASTVISIRQAAVARAERDRAVLETERTKQVTQFFQDVLSTPKPTEGGRDITVVEAIDATIPRIDATFASAPDLRAAIKNTLGSTLHDMGQYERARPLLEDALRLLTAIDHGLGSRERADAIYNLAGVENEIGSSARAETLYTQSIAMYGQLPMVDSSDIYRGMNNLATAIHAQGRLVEAAAMYGRVGDWLGTRGPAQRAPATVARLNQATALTEIGRYHQAEPLLREAAKQYEELYGPTDPRVATVLQPLAGALMFQEKFADAEAAARRAWAINARALGETNVTTVQAMRILLNILTDAERCAEAVSLADRIVTMRGNALAESDASIGTALLYGGWCRASLGEQAKGERQAREGLSLRKKNFPPDHWAIAHGESILGDVIAHEGVARRHEAQRLLRSGYEGLRRELDSTHSRVRQAKARLERAGG